jgi:hypothetical protein
MYTVITKTLSDLLFRSVGEVIINVSSGFLLSIMIIICLIACIYVKSTQITMFFGLFIINFFIIFISYYHLILIIPIILNYFLFLFIISHHFPHSPTLSPQNYFPTHKISLSIHLRTQQMTIITRAIKIITFVII